MFTVLFVIRNGWDGQLMSVGWRKNKILNLIYFPGLLAALIRDLFRFVLPLCYLLQSHSFNSI